MKLGVKFAPIIQEKDFQMLNFLEEKGVKISGVELQLFPEKTKQDVLTTLDILKQYNLEFVGIHPPFPSFKEELNPWLGLPVDYFVLHAGTHNTYIDLPREMKVENAVVENLYDHENRNVLCSLIETSLVSDNLLLDIAHLLYAHKKSMHWMAPWDQVNAVYKKIKVIHAADGFEGRGIVPQDGGTPEFRKLLFTLFEKVPNAWYVGEPYNGHKNNNKGHIENALAFWGLWNEFKDTRHA